MAKWNRQEEIFISVCDFTTMAISNVISKNGFVTC